MRCLRSVAACRSGTWCENGRKRWPKTAENGRKVGSESGENGRKRWVKTAENGRNTSRKRASSRRSSSRAGSSCATSTSRATARSTSCCPPATRPSLSRSSRVQTIAGTRRSTTCSPWGSGASTVPSCCGRPSRGAQEALRVAEGEGTPGRGSGFENGLMIVIGAGLPIEPSNRWSVGF